MALSVPAQPRARFVVSETNPHVLYKVTPEYCDCPAFRFQSRRNRPNACKHMVREFGVAAPTAVCVRCQESYPYNDASLLTRLYCPDCRKPVRAGHGWDRAVRP